MSFAQAGSPDTNPVIVPPHHGRAYRLPDRLLVVTPDRSASEIDAGLREALIAGARFVQLRRKSGSDAQRFTEMQGMVDLCRAAGATVIVNDRVDLALALGADGVHLGRDDLPVELARKLLGPDALIGVTCRDEEQARAAQGAGASYLGVGPVFHTETKAGLPAPFGVNKVAQVAAAVKVPVLAIGGIDSSSQARQLIDAGAYGVATVSAVFGRNDPGAAVADLRAELGAPR